MNQNQYVKEFGSVVGADLICDDTQELIENFFNQLGIDLRSETQLCDLMLDKNLDCSRHMEHCETCQNYVDSKFDARVDRSAWVDQTAGYIEGYSET